MGLAAVVVAGSVTAAPGPRGTALCPSAASTLAGVYHPSRLRVMNPCKIGTGVVAHMIYEQDGDIHVRVTVADKTLINAGNVSGQNGDLILEEEPRDVGHLPLLRVGESITFGAWNLDLDHAWLEIHPIFALKVGLSRWYRSGPQFGGSPASARSGTAQATCMTQLGAPCGHWAPRGTRLGSGD